MNHFFAANLNLLSSIFEEKQLEKISVIQESIAFDDSEHGEYSDVIYLPSGLGIANVSKSSKEAYIASFNNPKRWQTPLFSFQGCQYTSASSAFSAAIDSEYRPFLEYVMSSEINSAANINQPGKPTLIVCGFLNLVCFRLG